MIREEEEAKVDLPEHPEDKEAPHHRAQLPHHNAEPEKRGSKVKEPPIRRLSRVNQRGSIAGFGSRGSLTYNGAPLDQKAVMQLMAREYRANPEKPTTKLTVILRPRKRHKIMVNHDTTIGQLYQYVMFLTNTPNAVSFRLFSGYPPRPLTDLQQTVFDAKLLGASLEQKLLGQGGMVL